MRVYDSRLGKFLSVDPLSAEYAWNSAYSYAENDVIRSKDLDGKEKYIVNRSGSDDYGITQLIITLDQNLTLDQHRAGGVLFSFDGGATYNISNLNDPELDSYYGNTYLDAEGNLRRIGDNLMISTNPNANSSQKGGANQAPQYLSHNYTNNPGGTSHTLTCNFPTLPITLQMSNDGNKLWRREGASFEAPSSSTPYVPITLVFTPQSIANSLTVTSLSGSPIPCTVNTISGPAAPGVMTPAIQTYNFCVTPRTRFTVNVTSSTPTSIGDAYDFIIRMITYTPKTTITRSETCTPTNDGCND